MNILHFIKRLFIKVQNNSYNQSFSTIEQGNIQHAKDKKTGQITKSALNYDRNGNRFLKLDNHDCGLVLHPGGKIQVIFSKLYDQQNQSITEQQQILMALAVFLKKDGFAEMLRHQFHQIAMRNVNQLTQQE